jgi:hypothetical protein
MYNNIWNADLLLRRVHRCRCRLRQFLFMHIILHAKSRLDSHHGDTCCIDRKHSGGTSEMAQLRFKCKKEEEDAAAAAAAVYVLVADTKETHLTSFPFEDGNGHQYDCTQASQPYPKANA